jgi:hypothetical protein
MISKMQAGKNALHSFIPEYIVLTFILQQYNEAFKENNFHYL